MMENPLPPPRPPASPPEKTPAELALEREGGEIVPLDFQAVRPTAAETPRPSAEPRKIDAAPPALAGRILPEGEPAGPPVPGVEKAAPPTKEQLAHIARINEHINYEVNVYGLCLHAVDNLVRLRIRSEPPDSAELGESMFGPGKRTPLEAAMPEIAVEVYRQVRMEMRRDEREGRGLLALIGRVVRRILR